MDQIKQSVKLNLHSDTKTKFAQGISLKTGNEINIATNTIPNFLKYAFKCTNNTTVLGKHLHKIANRFDKLTNS